MVLKYLKIIKLNQLNLVIMKDHFESMFYEIIKNYNKLSFQNHQKKISNQIKLINTFSSIK